MARGVEDSSSAKSDVRDRRVVRSAACNPQLTARVLSAVRLQGAISRSRVAGAFSSGCLHLEEAESVWPELKGQEDEGLGNQAGGGSAGNGERGGPLRHIRTANEMTGRIEINVLKL